MNNRFTNNILTFAILLTSGFMFAQSVMAQTVEPASISLAPGEVEAVLPGSMIDVAVIFNSGGHDIDAVDVVINYDESIVEIENIQGSSMFSSYPLKEASNGVIKISGLADINSPVNTGGTFATFSVRIKSDAAPGPTELVIVTGGDTASHAAEHQTANDVLGSVSGAVYTVTFAAAPSHTPTPTPLTTSLPESGIAWPSYVFLLFSLLALFTGIVAFER